jgi:hypothetical protein
MKLKLALKTAEDPIKVQKLEKKLKMAPEKTSQSTDQG